MPRKSRKYRIRIQKEAVREVERIVSWIAEGSPRSAGSFLKGLRSKILDLSAYPERGARARLLEASGAPPIIRWIEFKKYLIFYAVEGSKVFVLHVTAPGQDWMRLFV
jgi:plasmid stabilization system protein ParE